MNSVIGHSSEKDDRLTMLLQLSPYLPDRDIEASIKAAIQNKTLAYLGVYAKIDGLALSLLDYKPPVELPCTASDSELFAAIDAAILTQFPSKEAFKTYRCFSDLRGAYVRKIADRKYNLGSIYGLGRIVNACLYADGQIALGDNLRRANEMCDGIAYDATGTFSFNFGTIQRFKNGNAKIVFKRPESQEKFDLLLKHAHGGFS